MKKSLLPIIAALLSSACGPTITSSRIVPIDVPDPAYERNCDDDRLLKTAASQNHLNDQYEIDTNFQVTPRIRGAIESIDGVAAVWSAPVRYRLTFKVGKLFEREAVLDQVMKAATKAACGEDASALTIEMTTEGANSPNIVGAADVTLKFGDTDATSETLKFGDTDATSDFRITKDKP